MNDKRPVRIKSFPSNTPNRDLESFVNSVDLVAMYSVIRSTVVNKEGVRGPDHAEAILFDGAWASVSGGSSDDHITIYGSRISVAYRDRQA